MARRSSPDIDPVNTPIERATRLYPEILQAAIDSIVPKKRDPFITALHEEGLTLKDLKRGPRN